MLHCACPCIFSVNGTCTNEHPSLAASDTVGINSELLICKSFEWRSDETEAEADHEM